MRVCFAVPVRDKLKYLPRCLQYALGQEFSPLEVIFSDQGSVDGSWELLKEAHAKYDGPHAFRIMQCPHTDIRGMPALNEHLNWIHNQTDADIFISCAADDFSFPQRTPKVVRAFEEFSPSMVANGQFFCDDKGMYQGETGYPDADGWVRVEELYTRLIGGSTIHAWTRELYEKVDGLQGVGSPDMVLPFLAVLDKGCYYLQERLHCYCQTSDENNTGLEGVMRAAKTKEEVMQIEELCQFQITAGLFTAALKMSEAGLWTAAGQNAIVEQVMDRANGWQHVRQRMAAAKVLPLGFKA